MVNDKKLGLGALIAIVFAMVVGSGLFNLPQNFAVGAGPTAVGVAWLITAVGMLLLVATFKILADRRPELNAGIYQYAQEGFGDFTGFNMAWGYWLCASFANIPYALMLNDSFAAFFPILSTHSWPTLIFGTSLIWVMFFIVAGGITTAKVINNILALLKVAAIALIIVLLLMNVEYGMFSFNFEEETLMGSSMIAQIKSTMLVTLWCFIGIEGAVMMSARAKNPNHVGKAGVLGFLISWLIYVLVSMLCYGVMQRAQLAGLEDPSVAYVLREICGDWAYYFVIFTVIVSLLGGWLSWTLICAQVPYEAASVKIFPSSFMRLNKRGMPQFGLFVASVIMQGFMIMVLFADDVYLAALNITSMMVLPAYLASGLYLCKISYSPDLLTKNTPLHSLHSSLPSKKIWRFRIVGILCSIYCGWLIYAGGLDLFIYTSFFYLAGIGFYLKARKERGGSRPEPFSIADKIAFAVIIAGLIGSFLLLANGIYPL